MEKHSDSLSGSHFGLAIVHSLIQLTFGGDHKGGSGSHIDVMALERKAHDEAEAHRQNGAHTKVNVLFLVQLFPLPA